MADDTLCYLEANVKPLMRKLMARVVVERPDSVQQWLITQLREEATSRKESDRTDAAAQLEKEAPARYQQSDFTAKITELLNHVETTKDAIHHQLQNLIDINPSGSIPTSHLTNHRKLLTESCRFINLLHRVMQQ